MTLCQLKAIHAFRTQKYYYFHKSLNYSYILLKHISLACLDTIDLLMNAG